MCDPQDRISYLVYWQGMLIAHVADASLADVLRAGRADLRRGPPGRHGNRCGKVQRTLAPGREIPSLTWGVVLGDRLVAAAATHAIADCILAWHESRIAERLDPRPAPPPRTYRPSTRRETTGRHVPRCRAGLVRKFRLGASQVDVWTTDTALAEYLLAASRNPAAWQVAVRRPPPLTDAGIYYDSLPALRRRGGEFAEKPMPRSCHGRAVFVRKRLVAFVGRYDHEIQAAVLGFYGKEGGSDASEAVEATGRQVGVEAPRGRPPVSTDGRRR